MKVVKKAGKGVTEDKHTRVSVAMFTSIYMTSKSAHFVISD